MYILKTHIPHLQKLFDSIIKEEANFKYLKNLLHYIGMGNKKFFDFRENYFDELCNIYCIVLHDKYISRYVCFLQSFITPISPVLGTR